MHACNVRALALRGIKSLACISRPTGPATFDQLSYKIPAHCVYYIFQIVSIIVHSGHLLTFRAITPSRF
jgi:hypothetical protein